MIHACISLLMFCHKPQTCEQKPFFLMFFLSIWHTRFCTNNVVLRALNSLSHLWPPVPVTASLPWSPRHAWRSSQKVAHEKFLWGGFHPGPSIDEVHQQIKNFSGSLWICWCHGVGKRGSLAEKVQPDCSWYWRVEERCQGSMGSGCDQTRQLWGRWHCHHCCPICQFWRCGHHQDACEGNCRRSRGQGGALGDPHWSPWFFRRAQFRTDGALSRPPAS